MSRGMRYSLLAVIMAVGSCGAVLARADEGCHYSKWKQYPQRAYSYSYCYYEPPAPPEPPRTPPPPQYHYCVHYPATPKYVYYYNPVKKSYWGRYDLDAKGYSLLAAEDCNENLKEIPESAFPKPGKMPQIPGARTGVTLLPPPDLPEF